MKATKEIRALGTKHGLFTYRWCEPLPAGEQQWWEQCRFIGKGVKPQDLKEIEGWFEFAPNKQELEAYKGELGRLAIVTKKRIYGGNWHPGGLMSGESFYVTEVLER